MTLIVCLDEKDGMMFHNRRQSQDRSVRADIIRSCGDEVLRMNAYSYRMFQADTGVSVSVSDDFLILAETGDYCFVEDQDVTSFADRIHTAILYRWNRNYPADRYFSLDLADGSWELERREEWEGFSHERITKEVYKRKNGTD